MEANVSGFTFFSTFDSGNLASVEAIPSESHPLNGLPEINDELPAEKGGPLSPADSVLISIYANVFFPTASIRKDQRICVQRAKIM